MKKYIKIIFLIIFINFIFAFSINSYAEESSISVSSSNALLMDYATGKILYEKNINEKIYPASTTKIMTAILVIENCDLNATVIISESAVNSVEFGYVTGNLKAGETFTVDALLHTLMVASANDAAFALAEYVSGSTDAFVELMNNKAIELGCKNTHFVNPNGIHNENHYTTAYDLALITKYALSNSTFKNIVECTSYELPATEFYTRDDRLFSNTNEMIMPYSNYYYPYATGVKTGYTSASGYSLVASCKKNNFFLICIVTGAKTNADKYNDTKALFEYGYSNYSIEQVALKNTALQTVKVKHATNDTKMINALIENNIYATVKNDSTEIITPEIKINNNLKAPINKGDVIGSVTYNIDGISYSSNLIASNNAKKSYLFINILIIVFICWLLIRLYKFYFGKKKKRKK